MKQAVIKELSTTELREKLIEEKGKYFKLRTNHSISPVENPMRIRDARRTIARIHTELVKRIKQETK